MGTKSLPTADGYHGIWYYCNGMPEPYKYKYSGGLGTYCAKHLPLAAYAAEVNKTFFCYGGRAADENRLMHMVGCFDHATGMVCRPRILLDKKTGDAHDNPTIMLDEMGFVWIFSSAHGLNRPACIHRSVEPYSIDRFELLRDENYSYPQAWWVKDRGLLFLHTLYDTAKGRPPWRFLHVSTSPDGKTWTPPRKLAAVEQGHYQISNRHGGRVGTAFNYHPFPDGLDRRTNIYYLQTDDFGETWTTAAGEPVQTPLTEAAGPALVRDYQAEGLNVYMKDINFDAEGNPIILVVTSPGHQPGPGNDPRTWTTARWTGSDWEIRPITTSDNNYDTGCLHVESDGGWTLIGPTETGPQEYNTGGEMALWTSADQGESWTKRKQLTAGSEFNHTYARRPVDAHPDFYALWADGHGRQESDSRLYICDRAGENVRRLPTTMTEDFATPERLK